MTVKNIVLAGTPSLRQASQPVDAQWFGTHDAKTLIHDLFDTMKARLGVGLAAPQIGVNLRVFIYGFEKAHERYPDQKPVPLTIMINPKIVAASAEKEYLYEGCLSVPDVRGLVPRHDWVEVQAQHENGQYFQKRYEGFEARIIQHEFAHIEGKLFCDYMDDMRTLGITSALRESGIIK